MAAAANNASLKHVRERVFWLVLFIALAFGVLLARLWYVQVLHGETYERASTTNIIRDIEAKAPRGRIFDKDMNILAENRPSFDVYLSPHIHRPKADGEVITLLRQYLNLPDQEVERILKKSSARVGEVLIARDISRRQVALIETDQMRLPGVQVRAESHRFYPLESVGAHTLGFVSEVTSGEVAELKDYGYGPGDYVGRMGLERAFEPILRGSPGIHRSVVDARGIPQSETEAKFIMGDYQNVEPIPGRDVVLTLDSELELIIDRAVRNYPSAGVVALNPKDGSILALYSKPGFNPNSWSGRLSSVEKLRNDNNPYKPMMDKSISAYFPGSTFKIAGALAVLEEGIMPPDEEIKCHGSYRFGGRRFRCWKRGGHGKMNLMDALANSCDVYFYKAAEVMGIDKIAEYGYRLGFGEHTGFSVNHESAGRVPTKEWHEKHGPDGFHPGFALNTVLGQGDTLATPLQTAIAYAAIANGGTIYHPRLVKEVRNYQGDMLFEFPPRKRKSLNAKKENLEAIQKGLWMTANVDGGTAYAHRFEGVEVAGKTGTAQVVKIGRVRVANRDMQFRHRDHAWFASYAPADDPEIVLVVLLEHGGHGGSDAAPVAMKILEEYFNSDRTTLKQKLPEALRAPEPSNLSDEEAIP